MLDNDTVIEKAATLKVAGVAFSLVTVVRCESPTSARPGAKAIVEADGVIQGWVGGGCVQPAVIKMSRQAILDGQSRLIRISPTRTEAIEAGIVNFATTCHSGGTLDIFIDPVIPRPTLLIIGVSPVAQSLCSFAHHAGFRIVAAFPNINAELFPDASGTIDNLQSVDIYMNAMQFIVVATQGKQDEAGLKAALNSTAGYIAFVSSQRKATKLRQILLESGQDKKRVDSIISPAGIDIGAVTPAEIALSVLAEVIKARRDGSVCSKDSISSISTTALSLDSADTVTSSVTATISSTTNGCCSDAG